MSDIVDATISMADLLNRSISLELVTADGTTYSISKEQLDIARAALSEATDAAEIERLRAQLASARKDTIEECATIADGWIKAHGKNELKYVSPRTYACDAVMDVADAIRALSLTDEQGK